jgi:hypothetical protein
MKIFLRSYNPEYIDDWCCIPPKVLVSYPFVSTWSLTLMSGQWLLGAHAPEIRRSVTQTGCLYLMPKPTIGVVRYDVYMVT